MGVPETLNGAGRLAVAIELSTLLIKELQEKKYISEKLTKEGESNMFRWNNIRGTLNQRTLLNVVGKEE